MPSRSVACWSGEFWTRLPRVVTGVLSELDYDQVGALPDVQVVSLPRSAWEQDKAAVLEALNRADGVIKVDVQEQKQRSPRWSHPAQ